MTRAPFWTAAALLLSAASAQAGWTRPQGELYLKLYNRLAVGPGGITASGTFVSFGSLAVDTSLRVYAEYGALPGLTVVAGGIPFGFAYTGQASAPYMGPLWAGFRLGPGGPLVHNLHGALELRYGLSPGWGEVPLLVGVAGNEVWTYTPTEQTHLFDGELQLGYGLPAGLWISARAGLRYGSRDQWEGIVLGFGQFGWMSSFGLMLEAHVNVYQPLDDFTRSNLSGAGPTRYVGAGLSASYWVHEQWAINLGLEGGIVVQANFAAPVITVGVEYRGRPAPSRLSGSASGS